MLLFKSITFPPTTNNMDNMEHMEHMEHHDDDILYIPRTVDEITDVSRREYKVIEPLTKKRSFENIEVQVHLQSQL